MQELYHQTKQGARVSRVQLPIDDRTVTTEVSGEVSLPDYQPEIKRLLRVSATVQPPAHYVGGGAMEFTGTVDFCIYYTGNDGQMYCFPTSQEYALRVPLEAGADFDLSDALVCYATCEPEAVISRVSGPRRMSVKCRLRARVMAYGSCVIEERRQGEAADEERLMQEQATSVLSYALGAPVTLSDDILLEREGDGEAGEWRIVSGDAQLLMHEAVSGSGQVNCRGEAVVKLLIARENGDVLPVTVRRKLPFEQSVPLEGAAVGGEALAIGHCTELDLSMEDGHVVCEVEVVPEVWVRREQTLAYTSDLYAVGHESRCETRGYQLPQALRCINGNMTVSETLTQEELGLESGARVADIYGLSHIENVEVERGKYIVSGKCRYTLILESEGEMMAKELERPFRYVADGTAEVADGFGWQGQATLVAPRARMDAERLAIEAELGLCLCIERQSEARIVNGFTVGQPHERKAGQVLLCYPAADDTLWSVGKRYGVSLDALAEVNHLPAAPRADAPESLGEARAMVI